MQHWHRCFSVFVAFSCECRGYLEEVDGVGENALSLCETYTLLYLWVIDSTTAPLAPLGPDCYSQQESHPGATPHACVYHYQQLLTSLLAIHYRIVRPLAKDLGAEPPAKLKGSIWVIEFNNTHLEHLLKSALLNVFSTLFLPCWLLSLHVPNPMYYYIQDHKPH